MDVNIKEFLIAVEGVSVMGYNFQLPVKEGEGPLTILKGGHLYLSV